MSPEREHELREMKRAAEILGELPPGALGTQEPVYRAYKILSDEIDRVETAEDKP